MVESAFVSDSPRSRSPMTEPSSPSMHDGPSISGCNHRYLYNYSPESFEHKLKIAMDSHSSSHRSSRNHEFQVHERNFSGGRESPIDTEQARFRPRELSRPSSSANLTTPTSLFTIDSILAPRPIDTVTSPNTTSLSIMQSTDLIGSPNRTPTIHPLQQQLHHLAFMPADFLGKFTVKLSFHSINVRIYEYCV